MQACDECVVIAPLKKILDDEKILQKHQKVLTNFFIYVYTLIIIITKMTKKSKDEFVLVTHGHKVQTG